MPDFTSPTTISSPEMTKKRVKSRTKGPTKVRKLKQTLGQAPAKKKEKAAKPGRDSSRKSFGKRR
jgi:hypothetical protein